MTAGRGIIHEEFHGSKFAEAGGTLEMCQLWLNLPKEHKMTAPRYQPINAAEIPEVTLTAEHCAAPPTPRGTGPAEDASAVANAAGTVRIIAGEMDGVVGPAKTVSPVELWDVSLPDVARATVISLPEGHTVILFVRRGSLGVGEEGSEQTVGAQGVALLGGDGRSVRLAAQEPDTQVLLLGGQPLNEPIAAQGPFVMNTRQELLQANMDFQEGRMGR